MKCKHCKKEIDKEEQCPGQYNALCFNCWHNGDSIPIHFASLFRAYKHNVGDNWKNNRRDAR